MTQWNEMDKNSSFVFSIESNSQMKVILEPNILDALPSANYSEVEVFFFSFCDIALIVWKYQKNPISERWKSSS